MLPHGHHDDYFDMFVNVMLGVGLVFELPILHFLSDAAARRHSVFLIRHSRATRF